MENFPNSQKILINQEKKEIVFESANRLIEESSLESRITALKSPITNEDFPSSSEILDLKPSLAGLHLNLITESSSLGDIPPPSSVSSSSSSLPEQGDFNIHSPFKCANYDGNASARVLDDSNATNSELLTTPLLKRRGPGRPRKDGNISTVTRKKIFSNPLSRINLGRPRGRKRQIDRTPISSLGGLLSGISGQLNENFKMGESSVSLISQLLDNQEKFDIPDLDSDNSLSSAVSLERFPSEEITHEHCIGKTCSFCNLGEKSLLGQGELTRFEPTTGFNPFRKSPKSRRGSSESERDLQIERNSKASWRRQKGRFQERSKATRRTDEDTTVVDELAIIGFPEEPDVVNLFEQSGHTYAHHCCASWSDGVCQTEDYVLINVDKAVIGGLNQKCSSCQRFGASIRCREPKCNKTYHYPCAVSSGTFQDIKTMSLLCPTHLHLAPSVEKMSLNGDNPHLVQGGRITDVNKTAESESNCIVCDMPGNISELLFCTSCGHHYHGQCLDPVVAVNSVVRSGWQCPDCKICHTCRQPGDDNKMLVCDSCDKSYHTYCLKPVMTSIPKHGWKCKSCRVCGDCGARTPGSGPSSRWHMNYSVCDSCYQQRNKGLACHLCGRAYRHFAQKEMVMCTGCKKFVHGKCDKEVANQLKDGDLSYDYLCPPCRKSPKSSLSLDSKDLPTWPISNFNSRAPNDDPNVPDHGGFPSSHDSSIPTNEDSFCSMDIDIQAIERSAQQLQQLSGNSNFDLFDDFAPNSGKVFPINLPNSGKLTGKKRIGIGRPRGGSKFVGMKRRAKTAEMGKRRGPKPKLKPTYGMLCQSPLGESSPVKLEEEPVLENKIVLCSAKDEFVLCQDMCIMCGSYGQGEEGRLICCSQCGQCYHPYCVSIKVTKVLLTKGWRCLDCTVCEGCGQPHDEGRLLLCDDCDISYHTYCLDPPLDKVPQGNWKCKWCVVCLQCGATDPGFNCQWQSNYTQCGPCSSQMVCPVCNLNYKEDELLIQCIHCDRWLHAICDEMTNEDDAEKSADYGYNCVLCRPKSQPPPHLLPPPPPSPPKCVETKPPTPPTRKSTPEPVPVKVKSQPMLLLDGVYLSESGMSQIKSLTLEQPKKQRVRRSKMSNSKHKHGCENEDSSLDQTMDVDKHDLLGDDELLKDLPNLDDGLPAEKKKRKRNLQKLGVGGFVARCRGRNLHKDDKEESILGELGDNQTQIEGPDTAIEKPKRRRRIKKKSQLEDSFPAYLQEAFFGKDLLVNSKSSSTKFEVSSDDEVASPLSNLTQDKMVNITEDTTLAKRAQPETTKTSVDILKKEEGDEFENDEEDIGNTENLKDILPLAQDDDIVKLLMNDDDGLSKTEVLEAANNSDLGNVGLHSEVDQTTTKDEPLMKDDPLTDILSPHFNLDTMVGDSGLPQIDGKDVEDLFKGVLTDNLPQGPTDSNFRVAPLTICQMGQNIIEAPSSQHPVPRPPMPSNVAMSSPFSVPPPSPYPSEYSSSSQFSPGFSEPPPSPWVPPEPELETQSYNQRSSLKWEKDETLGLHATISAVLYANTNHPDLKADYPVWTDRAKQIAKIWRALSSETRTPYVQKARENRTASRLQKTQQMKESVPSSSTSAAANTTPKQGKRPKQGKTPPAPEPVESLVRPLPPPPPPLPPPPPPPPPPPSLLPSINEKEQERMAREQKAHREQEQERQWKALQAVRQQQAQQQQQILQEQRAQVPSQQPHPLPAMVRVQQQMMGGEQLIKSPTSCGSITPTTPSSPSGQVDQFGQAHSMSINNPDSFLPPSIPQHPNLMQETSVHQVRMMGQEQLHVITSQSPIGVTPLPQGIQQAGARGSSSFTPPIQVSRVRPPIDTSQMRMSINDPYAQMPGTPRPLTVNPNMESFNRPLSHHSPLSPQIVRSPLRIQDMYTRQPFTPRPQNINEGFSGAGQKTISSKPIAAEMYAKTQMVANPKSQIRDSMSPSTPRTPDIFHTPPSAPHTPNQESFSTPNESFTQQSIVTTNSPFSPPHSSHIQIHSQDQYNHPLSHPQRLQESYPQQQSSAARPDPYLQQPHTPRPPMQQLSDMFGQQVQPKLAMPPVARTPQLQQQQSDVYNAPQRPNEQFQGGVEPRPRPKLVSVGGHYSSQGCEQQPSQIMEHYSQPRTPSTPRLNSSPLDDPYAQSPMTPRPLSSPSSTCARPQRMDQFQIEGELGVNQSGGGVELDQDQAQAQQMARHQLRDLLQKQQIKKQEHIASHGQQPLRHWPLEQEADSNQPIMHQNMQECMRVPGTHMVRQQSPELVRPVMSPSDNSFRQPYPPSSGMRPRLPMGTTSPASHQLSQQLHGQPQALMNQFRHPGPILDVRSQTTNVGDPQMRMAILQQQQRLVHASQLRGLNVSRPQLGVQQQQIQNQMDSYDNLVQQQRIVLTQQQLSHSQQQMSPMASNQMRMFTYQQASTGIRQQFVHVHPQQTQQQHRVSSTSPQALSEYNVQNLPMESTSQQQQICDINERQSITGLGRPMQMQSSSLVVNNENESLLPSETNVDDGHHGAGVPLEGDPSTAEKVAEELQRIEKESSGDLLQPKLEDPEEDLDDDELLGLGNDFNILEYADPELDKDIVGDGKKTNILDENLDLDDKDDDLEDDEVKTKVDSPESRVSDIKVEIEENANQQISTKEEALEGGNKQGASGGLHLGKSDFQAKFLEFSQKRELEKAEELKGGNIYEEDNLEHGAVRKTEDMKPNVKVELGIGDIMHNIPSVSFSDANSMLPENPVSNVMSPSSVCQIPNVGSNQLYLSPEGNQMMMIQRHMRPPFGQQIIHGQPDLRQQMIGPQQNQSIMKLSQPPPPPPYPQTRPPPPYQPVRGPNIPNAPMINRGVYNPMMLGFRQPHPTQGPPHAIPLSLNPAIRQAQVNEQRLLLEDLLEQEKQEQRRQQQQHHHNLLGQAHSDEPLLSDLEFEKLKADVLGTGGLSGSLSPPGGTGLPAQGILPHHSSVSPSSLKAPSPGHCGPMLSPGVGLDIQDGSQQLLVRPLQLQNIQQNLGGQMMGGHHPPQQQLQPPLPPPPPPRNLSQMIDPGVHPALMQGIRPPLPITSIPPPQTPPSEVITENDRQLQLNYEHWLCQQQHVLGSQQKYFEVEVAKLRKSRKSLNTKKRNLLKTGLQLTDTDALELERITREQTSLQKQLEQVRKQSRQHAMIMQEYHMKQQKQQQQQQQQQIINTQQMQHSPHGGTVPSPLINQGSSTPMSPLMSPSPLGPAHSPSLRQQSPSPMLQHSPLAASHSPLVQHSSPLGQQVFHQQPSPRHVNPNLAMDQQVMRQSGIQTSQEDNNPFSDNFQHRELRTLGTRPPHMGVGFQEEMEDRKPFKDQSCSPNPLQRWGQPNRPLEKLVPRGFHSSLGPKMMGPASEQGQHQAVYQQHSVGTSTSGAMDSDLSRCSPNIQPHISPHHSMGQSPTHYQLSSPNCPQTDRNIVSSLGGNIQTTSPSLSTGSSHLDCSTIVTSSIGSNLDSGQSSQSQMMPIASQQTHLENVSENPLVGIDQTNQDGSSTSLGMLLNDGTPMRRIFKSAVGPNIDRSVKNAQSNSEDLTGNNDFNVENNGSCVGLSRMPLRNPASFEQHIVNTTSTVECPQASYISSVESLHPKIKIEFDANQRDTKCSKFDTEMLPLEVKRLMNGVGDIHSPIISKIKFESFNGGENETDFKWEKNSNGESDHHHRLKVEIYSCGNEKGKHFQPQHDLRHLNNQLKTIGNNGDIISQNGISLYIEKTGISALKDNNLKNLMGLNGINNFNLNGDRGYTKNNSLVTSLIVNGAIVKRNLSVYGNNTSGSVGNKNSVDSKPSDSAENTPNDSGENSGNNSSSSDSGGNSGNNSSDSGSNSGNNSSDSAGSGGNNPSGSSQGDGNNPPNSNGNNSGGNDGNDKNERSDSNEENKQDGDDDDDEDDEENGNEKRDDKASLKRNDSEENASDGNKMGGNSSINVSTSEQTNKDQIRSGIGHDSSNLMGERGNRTTQNPSDISGSSGSRVQRSSFFNTSGDNNSTLNITSYNILSDVKKNNPSEFLPSAKGPYQDVISHSNVTGSSEIGRRPDLTAGGSSSQRLVSEEQSFNKQMNEKQQSQSTEASKKSSESDGVKREIVTDEKMKSVQNPGQLEPDSASSSFMPAVKIENTLGDLVCSTSQSIGLGFVRPPFPMTPTRPTGQFIKMPLHKAQRMSLATQLSTQLDVLTGNHPQPFAVGMGRGLSRGSLVPSVQPRISELNLSPNIQKFQNLSSPGSLMTSPSVVTGGGVAVPRVSQVGLPNVMSRSQQVSSTSGGGGPSHESKFDDDKHVSDAALKTENDPPSGCRVTVKQEMLTGVHSSEFGSDCMMKTSKDLSSSNNSKMGKEKRLFNFSLTSGHLDGISKSDGHELSIPQNALLKQLLQTSQPSTQFPKKQERSDPPVLPPPSVPLPPPPVYDTAAEVIASVAQLPPSPEHSLNDCSNDCNLTEEDRSKTSLDDSSVKSAEMDVSAKGKKGKGIQAKRQPKQKQVKDGGTPAKKRSRKGSNPKLEEDYDGFMETLRMQLQGLPNLRIMEPDIPPNFSVCPLFGSGQLSNTQPKASGSFGGCSFNNKVTFYLEDPDASSMVLPPTPPPQRGFYNQEFPSRYCAPIDEHKVTVGPDLRIPSSLLTPPPCPQDRREATSPDLIISSSSPECSLFEPPCRYPYLKLIDEGNETSTTSELNKSASPQVPLYFPIPIRARPVPAVEKRSSSFDFEDEDPILKDKENMLIGENKAEKEALLIRSKLGFRHPIPLKDSANVAITLTLTSSAAEDIRGVLSAVADLLKIPAPASFEITERTVTPPSQKLGLYKRGKDPSVSMQSFLNGQPKFCRHCDVVVLTSGIKKKWSEMPFTNKDEQEEDEVMFCSSSCYMQFALSHRTVAQATEKEVAAVVDHLCSSLSPSQSRLKSKSNSSGKSSPISESSKDDTKNDDSQGSNKLLQEGAKSSSDLLREMNEEINNKRDQVVSHRESVSSTSTQSSGVGTRRQFEHHRLERDRQDEPCSKKWKGVKWKHWSMENVTQPSYERASEEEIHTMLDRLNVCIKPKKVPADTRSCVLCLEVGDGLTNGAARLLNMDVDKWIHLNCALWSSEVYETVNGALMNVEVALKRGFTLDCVVCKRKGATLGCFRLRCTNLYHFTCAIKDKCMFFKDKTLLCPLHIPKQLTPEMKENELQNLSVSRRVYINRDENRQVASMMHRGDCNFLLRVGNLVFWSIGQLLPHQLQAFHSRNFIYPVGYKIIRMYWSMRNIGKRCQYICSIQDNEGRPEFHIQVKEVGYADIFIQARTARGVWQQIIEPIDRMRRDANAIKVFTAFITGEDLFGLNEPSILRVLESLPGVETLSDYNFKYGRSPLLDLPLAINPTGCARAEPKLRTHFKRPHTLHTSSSSRSSFQVAITGFEAACPYTKQFIHSKASQYRKMKVEWRNNVYLARSRIQGLGLYAAREIEKHTMVIEYLGELIRNEVAEKRERFYEDQNRGIYMFRVDDGRVIDASLTGGLARYINHSCNPNCVAEVVQIDRENRIIIFACRRIARGEELSYDYKFDIEDDQHKIPCLCGAPNCKKWMN